MWRSMLVVLGVLILAGAVLKLVSWARREKIVRTIDPESLTRSLRGVSLRVLLHGPTTLPGMNPDRANRTRGDLLVSSDRFVIASSRGVLVDVRSGSKRLTSVRCTGPGRLVLEGEVPVMKGEPGRYRIELVTEEAASWVETLAPFVEEGNGAYGSLTA